MTLSNTAASHAARAAALAHVPTFKVERNLREESNDYGKAGEIEWHLMDPNGECVEVWPLKRLAIAHRDRCNKALEIQALKAAGLY